jgi:hypothetical protein
VKLSKIEDKLKLLQKQIESTTEAMTRANLFLKKVELLKLQKIKEKIDSILHHKLPFVLWKNYLNRIFKYWNFQFYKDNKSS